MADEELNEEYDNNEEVDNNENTDPEELQKELEALRQEKEKMQESLKKANSEAEKRRKKLQEVEKYGDPEELARYKEWYEQQQQEENDKKSEVEKVKEKLKEQYEKDIETEREHRQKLEKTLETQLVENQIHQALTQNESEDTRVLPRYVRDYVKPDLESNRLYVVDDDGDARINAQGDYMTVNDFVSELKQDDYFQKFFKGVSQGGSGSKSVKEETRGRPKKPKSKSEMSVKDKANFISQYGRDEYLGLPD